MQLITLMKTLLNFAADPEKAWGEASDGWSKPTNIKLGRQAQVQVEPADCNSARLRSGTYTPEQYADFDRQCSEIEQAGSGTAYFPGNPDDLPIDMPEQHCSSCGKTFRACHLGAKMECYNCVLNQLCPMLPWRNIRCFWRRDQWYMEAFGRYGARNELTFWWSNSNSGGNASHQGFTVHMDGELNVVRAVFKTVASNACRCYTVVYSPADSSFSYSMRDRRSVNEDTYGTVTKLDELDPLVTDLMEAMLPTWMLHEYRPRNPINGCYSVD